VPLTKQVAKKPTQAQPLQANNKPMFGSVPLQTRPVNFQGTYPHQVPYSKPPIQIPSNRDVEAIKSSETNPTWETFTLPEENHLYDPRTSAAEAEKALRQLVEESHNDQEEDEVDMSLAEVEGFKPGVALLPHQVLGRIWMQERETGKKAGGILADDMGYAVSSVFISTLMLILNRSLGKTIQTLARIVDGRPKKSDKADGWAAATLCEDLPFCTSVEFLITSYRVVCPLYHVGQRASENQKICLGIRVIEQQ
jgi:hypothetical protein